MNITKRNIQDAKNDYKALQAFARELGIKPNQKKEALYDQLINEAKGKMPKPELSTISIQDIRKGDLFKYPTTDTQYIMEEKTDTMIKVTNRATGKEWNCTSERELTREVILLERNTKQKINRPEPQEEKAEA